MKKLLIAGLLMLMPAMVQAKTTVTVDENNASPNTVVVEQGQTAVAAPAIAIQQTPIYILRQDAPKEKEFDGEIIDIDYKKSEIQVRDTTLHDRRVTVKQGMIGTYKTGDFVHVELMADMKEAKMIREIRDVRLIEGTVVAIDPAANQIVIRDRENHDRTVLLAPGMTTVFRQNERVKIYLAPQGQEVRFIRGLE